MCFYPCYRDCCDWWRRRQKWVEDAEGVRGDHGEEGFVFEGRVGGGEVREEFGDGGAEARGVLGGDDGLQGEEFGGLEEFLGGGDSKEEVSR